MADAKQTLIEAVRQQTAMANTRMLVDKLNEHCFERCVASPTTSLGSAETSCVKNCIGKYVNSWDTVSKQYAGHIQRKTRLLGQ
ncbi:hypothetical protein K470DRAFT_256097 [Piedraia hortae CBS 480.64]|uniref:Mitochondrial import inner membrane translocase subunit n=1 Tax=Piedraia hortae CBS 480.64 TaxID=1314780 RepID=A0A6A7C5E1_9PEZI|nr:hypothetical protein K470DRAFT_256097 [Piedraia hortae CBS 480.64]